MRNYRSFLLGLLLVLATSFTLSAQADVKFGDLDKSPMDAAHYPLRSRYKNYLDEDDADRDRRIKVLYSRPQKKDRRLFGGIIPWGTDWRLGANEATEVTFYNGVEIGGTFIPRGTYTMFAEVYPSQWIIKISTERFIGGSENRDKTKDLVAVGIPTGMTAEPVEYFSIGYKKIDDLNVDMVFAWGNTQASLPISLSPTSMEGEDASPMDLLQYPNMSRLRNYVEEKDLAANEPQVRVVYSRPQKKGRKLFGELIKYGEVWRMGANETTLVSFFNDVTIDGKEVKAGTYGLFARPTADKWEFILHKNTQSWGNANHDDKDNVLSFSAATEKTPKELEALSMTFVEAGDKTIHLVVGWGDTMARLPIVLK